MQNSLLHVGILGMKWGRRKGPDISSSDHITANSLKKKKLNELSNDELKKLTTRMQLERSYKDLSKTEIGNGRKMINDMLSEVGKSIAKGYVTKYVTMGLEKGGAYILNQILKKYNKG